MQPTQNGPAIDHSSANSTSAPGSSYRSQHVESHFIPFVTPTVSSNYELLLNRNETTGFAMNDAPPAYNECIQLPLYDIGSLPAYNELCGSPPAYDAV